MSIIRLQNQDDFHSHRASMQTLLQQYHPILADDFTHPDQLIHHIASNMPYVWIDVDSQNQVRIIASLSDVIPGHSAFLHGVSCPSIRRHPTINAMADTLLNYAFQELGLHKLKAEFETHNLGAIGFCRRMGFTREARFKAETKLQGQWHDVCRYVFFADSYFSKKGDYHVIRS